MERDVARERLARESLRWDAAYCMLMGGVLAAFFSPIATALEAPKPLLAIGGVSTVIWGGLVARMSTGDPWRRITMFVAVTNLVVTATMIAVGLAAEVAPSVRVVIFGIALQVGGFAALQGHALWSRFVR